MAGHALITRRATAAMEDDMALDTTDETGPDLTQGIAIAEFDGREMLRGHVGEEAVLLARVGTEYLAVGATCSHYGGPLDQGILLGETVRCPWHHARFSLRSGEAVGAPAFDPLPRWKVEQSGGRIRVLERADPALARRLMVPSDLHNVIIIGGGAAGFSCAEMLRRRGYGGRLLILSADCDPPCDRPNLSKDYLAGTAPEEWIPLRPDSFYADSDMDLRLNTKVTKIDTGSRTVTTAAGEIFAFDRLVLAMGAEPVRLPIAGADQPHVFALRSLADSRAIAAAAGAARTAVVLGSGFIGLETAASLRERNLDVHVVSLDQCPLEHVLGDAVGAFVQQIHEDHGVHFHMQQSIRSIGEKTVVLQDSSEIAADLVIIGVGVRPRTRLAEEAGLATDNGVLVNAQLETDSAGIYAAGDIAAWPAADGGHQRVEHWVVAERQGQVVAENILGAQQPFRDAPFFWSMHYDVAIRYVGHGQGWDEVQIEGSLAEKDCLVRYRKAGRTLAVATIGRDIAALQCGCQLQAA